MRKLAIVISAIVAVILVIGLVVPLGMGFWVKKRYPMLIQEFNTAHITFQLINFNRGWFHSHAQLQVTVHHAERTLSGEPASFAQFIVEQEIKHGPIIFLRGDNGKRHVMVARAAMQNESQDENLNFSARTLWTMTNSLNTRLDVRHIFLGNEQQRIEINQLVGKVNFTPSNTRFESNLSLANGSLYIKNPERVESDIIDLVKVAEVNDFNTRLNIRKIDTLWYGIRHFTAKKLVFLPTTPESLQLDAITIDFDQTRHDNLTNVSFISKIDAVNGSQLKINQVKTILDLTDINTKLLKNFVHVFMYGAHFQRLTLYSLIVDLFAKGMDIDLKQLQFTTEEGPVSLQAQISSASNENPDTGIMHLMETMNIQAMANMPRQWLENSLVVYFESKKRVNPHLKIDPQQLAKRYVEHWLEHRLLVSEDHQVTTAIKYKNGRLLINGEKPALNNFIVDDSLNKIHE